MSESSIFGAGSKQLAFVRDVNDPSAVRVSLGGALGVTGVFAVQSRAPDPSIVTTSTGAVMYRLSISSGSTASATLLAQLVADDRLKAEAFPAAATPTGFTSAALTYPR